MASHATGDGGIPKRGVEKDGLKRIMTLGGAYGTRNYTCLLYTSPSPRD